MGTNNKPQTPAPAHPSVKAPAANLVQMPNFGFSKAAVNPSTNWARKAGLPSFSQLVIGTGPTPTNAAGTNPNHKAGKKRTALANNALAGQTVSQYYAQAKALGHGAAGANNVLQAVKHGQVTLWGPAPK